MEKNEKKKKTITTTTTHSRGALLKKYVNS